MRITFVLRHADMSGGTRVVATYANRLRRRGHKVCVVSVPRRPPTLRDLARGLVRQRRWIGLRPPRPSHLDSVDVPHHVLDDDRPAREQDLPDADAVIATWWQTAEWVAELSPQKGVKVHFVQHYETWGGPEGRVNAALRLPTHKIVISRWLLEILRERFGHEADLVPNAVDLDLFNAPPRGKQPRPTVGFMYSIASFKACDIILEAVATLRKNTPDLRVICFGSTRPTRDLPVPPDVEFAYDPKQEELRRLYASCDLWLFGSRVEGFGLPLLEAMACRTPVVATPAGAAPELLRDGGGMLVKFDEPADMAAAAARVLALPQEQWRAMSDAAWRTARSYTWDDATDLFEQSLQRAVESARSVVMQAGRDE